MKHVTKQIKAIQLCESLNLNIFLLFLHDDRLHHLFALLEHVPQVRHLAMELLALHVEIIVLLLHTQLGFF